MIDLKDSPINQLARLRDPSKKITQTGGKTTENA